MIKKNFLFSAFILFFCITLNFSNQASAKVYVDINSPAFKLIPVAICDFNNQSINSPKQEGPGLQIAEDVKKDLSLTGIFNILNQHKEHCV